MIPFYLLRLLHGVAHGGYLAASYAYIADLAPTERRGEVIGIYATSNVVAMAFFPAGTNASGSFAEIIIPSTFWAIKALII
jgi:predicted MFS family arabinose efflux permease